MSLKPDPRQLIPELTQRIARAAFPKGNVYMTMRDEFGLFFQDEQFEKLFSRRGPLAIGVGDGDAVCRKLA